MNSWRLWFSQRLVGDRQFITLCTLLFISALSLALRVAYSRGLLFDQSVNIAYSAERLVQQGDPISNILTLIKGLALEFRQWQINERLSIPLTAFSFTIFGTSKTASFFAPIFSSALLVFVMFSIGEKLIGKSGAWMAVAIWAVLPIGAFLFSNLLEIGPIILLNTFAFSLIVQEGRFKYQWLAVTLLICIGLYVNWAHMGSTILFFIFYLLGDEDQTYFIKLLRFLLLAILLVAVLPGTGAAFTTMYNLVMLISDNLLIIPLLLFAIILTSTQGLDRNIRIVLLWLAVKAVFLVLAAKWIIGQPEIAEIGISGYWLDLLVPAVLIIGHQLGSRLESLERKIEPMFIGWSLVNLLFIGYLVDFPFSTSLLTISRIAAGVAFLLVYSLLLLLWRAPKHVRLLTNFLFLTLFSLASFSITSDYLEGYLPKAVDVEQALTYVASTRERADVFVDSDIYPRVLVEAAFLQESQTNMRSIIIEELNPYSPETTPPGSFIIISETFQNLVMGFPPRNWSMIRLFSESSEERLFVYFVAHQ